MGQTVVVTGGLGHIGSQLIRDENFLSAFDSVIIVDDLSTQRYPSLFNLKHESASMSFVEGRSHDLPELIDLSGVDAIVHLAALTDAAGNAHRPDAVFENNLEATKRLADASLHFQCRLIFPSSTSVYGSQSELVDESCVELNPQSPYAESKIQEEAVIQEAAEAGCDTLIFRLGTIFGVSPGMRFHTAVNRFCWQAVTDQRLTVWRTALTQMRPYLHLDDAVHALVKALSPEPTTVSLLNLVSQNASVQDIIDIISEFGLRPEIEFVDSPIMNQLSYAVDRRAAESLGYYFSGTLEEGIVSTLKLLGDLRYRKPHISPSVR